MKSDGILERLISKIESKMEKAETFSETCFNNGLQTAIDIIVDEMQDECKKLDEIKQIADKWNNDASHSFSDMCKINGILKE